MRTMELNKVTLWLVEVTGETDVVDGKGYYTGEIEKTYSSPVAIKLPLYPYVGNIHNEIFGTDVDCDFITVSNSKIETDSLLFSSLPTNFEEFDYTVVMAKESLNVNRYALRKRK